MLLALIAAHLFHILASTALLQSLPVTQLVHVKLEQLNLAILAKQQFVRHQPELAIMLNLVLLMQHLDQEVFLVMRLVIAEPLIIHAPLLEVLASQIMDAPL